MKIAALTARILLGIMFTIFGLNGFLQFIPQPPLPPGAMATFTGVLFTSHYYVFVFAVQLLCGILLLANQFVPLALTLLGPVIANILVFHITMQPAGLPPGILATILWAILAWRLRSHFAALLVRHSVES
jgi:putative oxidoreductase